MIQRPVKNYPMIFGFWKPYPPAVAAHTGLTHHWGQDFACPKLTDVLFVPGFWLGARLHRGYGYMAEVLMPVGLWPFKKWYVVRYAHLTLNSAISRPYGATVRKGEVGAKSGSTGTVYSDGPGLEPREHSHVHIEVWRAQKIKEAWVRTQLVDPSFITGEA